MTNKEKVFALISAGKKNREICQETGLSLRTVERYRKQYNETTVATVKEKTKKSDKEINANLRNEIIKARIISGETIRDVAKDFGVAKSTIGSISRKYNLQAKQIEFLKEFRSKNMNTIISNKEERLSLVTLALSVIRREIETGLEKGYINKTTMEKLVMNEQLEQEIIEAERVYKLERLELEKTRSSTNNSGEDKTLTVIDRLTDVLKEV